MPDLNVTNLFVLSYDQINVMKKKDLVNHIENLKGKVTVDATIKKLCNEILQQLLSLNNLMIENGKISSHLMVASKVNTLLITCVAELDGCSIAKETMLRYLVISNEISDENLEEKVIDSCKESGIKLNSYNIEACHRLPSGRVNTSNSKREIVKFVNRKHSNAMLHLKKLLN